MLREEFLVPFEAAVVEAKVGSVMASYNEIDGIPSHVNHWLLDRCCATSGASTVTSSPTAGASRCSSDCHHVAADDAEAARHALAAGVDFELDGSVSRRCATR